MPHPAEAVPRLQVPQQRCVDVVHAGSQVHVGQGRQLRQHPLRGMVPQACRRLRNRGIAAAGGAVVGWVGGARAQGACSRSSCLQCRHRNRCTVATTTASPAPAQQRQRAPGPSMLCSAR